MKNKIIFILSFLIIYSANSKVLFRRPNKRVSVQKKYKKKVITKKYVDNNFSHAYSKIINLYEDLNKKTYIWLENNCANFTELILSWNAIRPKKGKYSFFVSAKYNNRWSNWAKISEWTDRSQKTFSSSKNNFVHTKHVRLEMQRNKKANGFRVKVLAAGGANIRNLRALFVSTSDMNKFIFEKRSFNNKTVIIKGVPKVSQWSVKHYRAKDFCSPTSTTMLLGYYSRKGLFNGMSKKLSEHIKKIASKVHDDSYLDIYGSWPLNIAQAFDCSKGKLFCRVERLNGINHLYDFLKKKVPVAVSVRGYLKGGFKRYDNGHFIVVVGWDNKRKALLCIDPAFATEKKMLRAYNLKDFLRAWGTSRNLAYIIESKIGRNI